MIEEDTKTFTYPNLFSKKYIRRTFTAVSAQIWQQLTGMNVLMYYITYIFQMAGYEGNQMLVFSSIQYVINAVVTAVALVLFDKLGRRRLLFYGGILMMAWLFAVGGLFAQYSVPWPDSPDETVTIRIPADRDDAAKGIIACCYLFDASFAITWGVGVWGYVAELWGDSASRQRGAALATAANRIMNFVIAIFSPPAFKNINWKTYFIFETFCGCMTIHVLSVFLKLKISV